MTEGSTKSMVETPPHRRNRRAAFTLVELMLGMTVVSFILLFAVQMIAGTERIYSRSQSTASQFREARRAFDTIVRQLSQATLAPYWDYERDRIGNPLAYIRQSELHFVSGETADLAGDSATGITHGVFFQAPLGYFPSMRNEAGSDLGGSTLPSASSPIRDLEHLLNAWGFFVSYSEEINVPPFIENSDWYEPQRRFRLMEFRQPASALNIYVDGNRDGKPDIVTETKRESIYQWFRGPMADTTQLEEVASNIVALVISPQLPEREAAAAGEHPWSIAPDYLYDSRESQWNPGTSRGERSANQVPPIIRIALVTIDEASARRLDEENLGSTPDFGLDGLFRMAEDYEDDLATLEENLDKQRVNYRVFTAAVGMRTAKWSE